jgi:hypothetical protein
MTKNSRTYNANKKRRKEREPPLHTRRTLHSAPHAAASQSTNEVFLLIKLSVALVRNNVCSLKMIELSKHVGAN